MDVLINALIALLEKELIKHGPEIEEFIIEQLEKAGRALMDYVNAKLIIQQDSLPFIGDDEENEEDYRG